MASAAIDVKRLAVLLLRRSGCSAHVADAATTINSAALLVEDALRLTFLQPGAPTFRPEIVAYLERNGVLTDAKDVRSDATGGA